MQSPFLFSLVVIEIQALGYYNFNQLSVRFNSAGKNSKS